MDLPGHRRSALPAGGVTVAGMAARLDALLDELGEPPLHVVGISLGACVGLALALRRPERVRSLVLVNGFPRLRPAGAASALRIAARLALLATAPMSAVARLVAAAMFPAPSQAGLRAAAVRSLSRTSRRAYLASIVALARFDVRARLGEIRCPTLVVAGLDDRTVGREATDALAAGIPGARVVLVPGSGHATTHDSADVVNRVLIEFLGSRALPESANRRSGRARPTLYNGGVIDSSGARRGAVVWLTGLPSAGKSTIAEALEGALTRRGVRVQRLDGDEIRTHLSRGLGFSKADRDEQVRRVGWVAGLLERHGIVTISALVSPYREARDAVRASTGNFVEVYVKCSLEECIRRDVKGLYRRAQGGEIANFTGISDPYEPPPRPEVVVETDRERVDDGVARILDVLTRKGCLDG